ncbi:MAG: sugar transferase [Chloroflexi bacterium]|nr:sugar transferase [Chloroflexota bacterium]
MKAAVIKRLLDVVLSAVALVLLAPPFLLVALAIKMDSRGPVFHRGVRVGKSGKPFRIYKLRSMVSDAEVRGGPSTPADDPRITRMGRIVRRYNLDELAQFINTFLGDMSIVGPRPEVPEVVALYSEADRETILSVRPGITDWATLWIRDEGKRLKGSSDPHQQYLDEIWPEKRRLQLRYVHEQSVMTDLRIMLLTFKVHLVDRIRAPGPATDQ